MISLLLVIHATRSQRVHFGQVWIRWQVFRLGWQVDGVINAQSDIVSTHHTIPYRHKAYDSRQPMIRSYVAFSHSGTGSPNIKEFPGTREIHVYRLHGS